MRPTRAHRVGTVAAALVTVTVTALGAAAGQHLGPAGGGVAADTLGTGGTGAAPDPGGRSGSGAAPITLAAAAGPTGTLGPAATTATAAATAARIAAGGAGRGTTSVTVRFARGVRPAVVTRAAAFTTTARRFGATTRSTADALRAATFTVPDGDVARFVAAMRARPDVAQARVSNVYLPLGVPADPQYDDHQRDYLRRLGMENAWSFARGSASVRVAVVDSGVDVTHPDLAAKVVATRNTHLDNGDVTDDMGHGTFVAGVAAAATGNDVGVAGVGWNTRIVAVKVADAAGVMTDADVAEGIVWAADQGAQVINLSLGSPVADDLGRDAVRYARDAGALVVASAGNSGQDGNPRMYPAAFPGVVAVGATSDGTHRASFSEYGSWVTLAAPGVGVRSTAPMAGSDMFPGRYAVGDGTSFSAPIVAGAAALLWARSATKTAGAVRAALLATAAARPGQGLGAGEVRVDRALLSVVPPGTPTITAPAGGTYTGRGALTFAATPAAARSRVGWWVDGRKVGSSTDGSLVWDVAGRPNRAYTVQARTCAWSGTRCASGGPSVTVTLARAAPTITAPADGATATGLKTIQEGGTLTGLRAVAATVDGDVAFVDADPPLAPQVSFSPYADGVRRVRLVECDVTGTRCAGPASAPVDLTVTALHPTLRVTANRAFSPDGDGVKDTVALRYTLDVAQDVTVLFVDAAGRTQRRLELGTVAAGTHRLTWDGRRADRTAAPQSAYTVRLDTAAGALRGRVTTSVSLRRSDPTVGLGPAAASVHPAVDGWRDTFTVAARWARPGTARFTVRDARGAVVRRVTVAATGTGRAATRFTWNGRNDSGDLVPAGRYTWRVGVTDPAGNTTTRAARPLTLLRGRLVTRTVTLARPGEAASDTAGTAGCAVVTRAGSAYARGLWLKNDCPAGSDHQALAWYRFRLPPAARYTRLRLVTGGRSHSRPVDLMGAVWNRHTGDYDYTAMRAVTTSGDTAVVLGAFPADGRSVDRTVEVVVYVPRSRRPLADWDVRDVRLVVTAEQPG